MSFYKTTPHASTEFVSPGHYYSIIPDKESIAKYTPSSNVPGVNLNLSEQIIHTHKFAELCETLPFTDEKIPDNLFYYRNGAYSYGDAIVLHCMLRSYSPVRLVEVGSGFSTCVMMDTNRLFLGDRLKITCIEPFPATLNSLTNNNPPRLLDRSFQEVDSNIFYTLKENDILFLDSTHVSKIGSDVNRIFFEILPNLSPGVLVHFHDIFWPFEYPKVWTENGVYWNEAYLLRSFLQFNDTFEILFFSSYMASTQSTLMQDMMPLFMKNPGANIWLRKKK